MTQFLDYALKYASLGWQVFPLMPCQKIPFPGTHGVKDATADEVQIRTWWEKWPNANIAIACGKASNIYVVDVDVTEAGDVNGHESLKEFPALPETIKQNTPRGGFHAFYFTDDSPANRNSFRPGIDIRGNGYYVVAAPSVHPNGGKYVWAQGCAPWEREPAEFPEFLRPSKQAPWTKTPLLRAHDVVSTAPASADILQRASLYLAECDPAIQGQRGHDKLLWAAVAMVHGFLLSDSQALDLLTREYNPRCVPPWDLSITKDDKDFRRKVSEAQKLAPDKPRGWLLEDESYAIQPNIDIDVNALLNVNTSESDKTLGGFFSTQPPNTQSVGIDYWIIKKPSSNTKDLTFLTQPTGLLGEICEWINTTAIKPQPLLTLACVLPFLGVLFGRKIRDSLGSRTNLYCMGIAPSSAGKAHAPNQIRKLCEASGCVDLLGGSDVASDAAIEERMSLHPASLFLWDEIGYLLSHIRSGISQHHVRIVPLLMKLYSASGSIYKGREYADMDRQRTIIQPCCCIYGTSTPERFSSGVTPEELQDGWLSRCLVFLSHDNPPKERHGCDVPPPPEICEKVTAWATRQITITDGRSIDTFVNTQTGNVAPPEQIIVPRTPDAEKLFLAFDGESITHGQSNPELACLWAKAEENARRIALICAASENFQAPEITTSIAEYACRLVRYLLSSFGSEIVPTITTSHIDAKKQKLVTIIEKHGTDGCWKRDLTRASQWTNNKERTALLADLVEAEQIIAQIKKTNKGAPATCFWTVENYRRHSE